MKKTYIKPNMLVMRIQLQQMVTASPGAGAKTLYTNEEADEYGTVLSRRGGWFDDDED